ncbi:AlwI family type II restriction endonuclease [Glaesserella sp.]|uniref:AlwI family type II restriction endonuclease n=1 Tax=Glaesserella sp. TaxID=2094731 RepID=UPI0035A040E2
MASLSKSKHLFGFTSPRTLEKIIPELGLLSKKFSGKKWNTQTQIEFFDALFSSDFYEGEKKPSDPALAARDRITRAPKALGFIQLEPSIHLTKAGEQLISGKRLDEVFTKQLLKFQLPSPYHTQSNIIEFNVKPYLELLRLIDELGSISKLEIALFFLQLTNFNKFDIVKNKIISFRERRKTKEISWRSFVSETFSMEIKEVFHHEIINNQFYTRESSDSTFEKFIKTKESNMRDYADAFFRYIRATELVTIDSKTMRIKISPSKINDVKFILENIDRNSIHFDSVELFQNYLFDPDSLYLLSDNKQQLINKIKNLSVEQTNLEDKDTNELKEMLSLLQIEQKNHLVKDNIIKLKKHESNDLIDIYQMFDKITDKEVPDAPLFLEWNVWRAFAALNHTKEIHGNFIFDLDGMPLNTAPGNKPDIEINYGDFSCIVEVTMSRGETQFNMEGSSVARHYGDLVEKLQHNKAYCFFIAPKISESTKAFFFNLNRMNTKRYGGKTKIIPMNLNDFIKFIQVGIMKNFSKVSILENWLNQQWLYNQEAEDEDIWFKHLQASILQWI